MKQIVEDIKADVPKIVDELEQADRRAEQRQLEWKAAEERRLREDDARKVEQSILDSKSELQQIIDRWKELRTIDDFLERAEKSVGLLTGDEQASALERLKLARAFLLKRDPLQMLNNWRTPEERYRPKFSSEEASAA